MTNAGTLKKMISIVVPLYNEEEVFPMLKDELSRLMKELSVKYDFEAILVNDGSRDGTWDLITAYAKDETRVFAVNLSRNFGHQMAITCGYDLARGEAVVSMDGDLQDPPAVIADLIREWEKGFDIVYAVRKERKGESLFKTLTASIFYRIFKTIGHDASLVDSGDFRLMSKKSLAAFRKLREEYRYIRGMVGWVGFRTSTVEYLRQPRPCGKTKFSLVRMLSFGMNAIISFSFLPLRLAYIFSAVGTAIVVVFLANAFMMNMFLKKPLAPGWLSLILSIVLFGFLNLLSLGIIGEYIGRIYGEVKKRPLYLVREIIENSDKKEIDPYPGPSEEFFLSRHAKQP